jgi:acetyl/propionyl-CoA carboxylase alpha subunit/acetyl-CoA carboxylase carboxyltransferase component
MPRAFERLAIVNRGEPAMRVIHAVRELNAERADPIRLIALYTDPERNAMFVRHADEGFSLGSPTFVDPEDGRQRSRYLDHAALERALVETRADAVWVGWGFVAEQAEFVELCDRLGVAFVGPSADVMRRLGDKIQAKLLAEEADVPVAPWSGGPVADAEAAVRAAEGIGFPLMVKAAAGGGGRGIRRVEAADELPAAIDSARAEALAAFGDATLLLEKVITGARHVEVQVIADGRGGVWSVGLRDCSCQRRNQKVLEESASTALDAAQERQIMDAAARLAGLVGYAGAGTVEFLYQPDERAVSFMEVNTRLQVEHPVTEMVTGADLVKLQLHVAEGGTLEGDPPPSSGHAIEVRLNAEDPALGFAPTPGRVELLRLPTGPGIRIDTGVSQGDLVPAEFDSMIAKVIAWGRDRDESIARLRRALGETVVVLDDGTTNQGFLLELLGRPELRAGELDTHWLDRLQLQGDALPARHADVALLQAAVELFDAETALDRSRFYAFARRGRPEAAAGVGRTLELRCRGQGYRFRVAQVAPRRYRLEVDGRTLEVEVDRLDEHERRLALGGDVHRTVVSSQGAHLLVEVNGVPHRISRDERGLVRSLAPAVVVAIPVEAGDHVEAGDVVAVVESMKMESSLAAPVAGRVHQILAGVNVQVQAGAPLLRIDPAGEDGHEEGGERISYAEAAEPAEDAGDEDPVIRSRRCRERIERLGWMVLGYDLEPGAAERLVAELHESCSDLLGCDPQLVPAEHGLLEAFADLRAVARPRPEAEDVDADLIRSPQEQLHRYLSSLDPEVEGLPGSYVALLERALAHYGADPAERTPELEDACYRLFLSQRRSGGARAAVTAILDNRLEQADYLVGAVGPDFRGVLDLLVTATEGVDPVIADLAREVRFRYYDEPVIEAARQDQYAEMDEHLRALAEDPRRPDRDERVRALAECPQPLAPLLTRLIGDAPAALRRVLIETMTRRYYRMRELAEFGEETREGTTFLTSSYLDEGRRHHLAVTFIDDPGDLAGAVRAIDALAAGVPASDVLVADVYARHADEAPPHERLAADLHAVMELVPLSPAVARIVVAVAEPRRGRGMSAVDLFTFRPAEDGGVAEDVSIRGLHPIMGERLHLWRLAKFDIARLPSPEDVHFYRGVARENPKDERLFAIAEVRSLTPVRDEEGRLIAIPELEQKLVESLEAMRNHQSHLPPRRRPLWNRVLLHAWTPIEQSAEEIRSLVARHAPSLSGLGIEMIVLRGRIPRAAGGADRLSVMRFFNPTGHGVVVEVDDAPDRPIGALDEPARRIIAARRRGTLHPAEIVKWLAPARSEASADQPAGAFEEHDLDEDGRLVPVDRQPAANSAGVVVGLIRNFNDRYPEGMLRVALLGDPTRALGALAEPECRRIIAALDLAEELGVPAEWFALSAGAKIAMDSGTENMDWIAAVLRRIIEFTQRGNELNVVVCGINVGAQPYWNAEATMLLHTKGILVMTPESAMVLTGKQALDYSGSVSAEDNFGIGGFDRVMGPNGQAQYWAGDITGACRILLAHYDHSYVAPGERFPRRADTSDPLDRDVRGEPHSAPDSDLRSVGEIFSDETNPGRKRPFDIRSVMRAAIDRDHPPLERWGAMAGAETGVVWDAHLGGWPVTLLGFESRPLRRHGSVPADGPDHWSSGTLFPRSSKKIARAINAASGNRPVVVLANLAGFDGSPESMRKWQLEYGAEIGRAVVNFDGPIVFCVVSRYHGGAFVVFSQRLNERLEAVALEGARASVIGGAPAAATVFAREVEARTQADPRMAELEERVAAAEGVERQRLRAEQAELHGRVRSEKLGELADEFDAVHSVERAVRMGSVTRIIQPARLRPYLIEAIERGMQESLARAAEGDGRGRLADPLAG